MSRGRRERIVAAQRAGLRSRMVDVWQMAEADADALLAAWEAEAERRGMRATDPGYWSAAEPWLEARRTTR